MFIRIHFGTALAHYPCSKVDRIDVLHDFSVLQHDYYRRIPQTRVMGTSVPSGFGLKPCSTSIAQCLVHIEKGEFFRYSTPPCHATNAMACVFVELIHILS